MKNEDREIVGLQILSGLRIFFSSGRRHLWTASYDYETVEEYLLGSRFLILKHLHFYSVIFTHPQTDININRQ